MPRRPSLVEIEGHGPLHHLGGSRPLAGVALLLSVIACAGVSARTCRVDLTPNGAKYSCLTCHLRPTGGIRNPFGLDVEAIIGNTSSCGPRFWGPALAALDSDRDGLTNGVELGDPDGLWTPGTPAPGDPSLVTHPGVPEPPRLKPEVSSVVPQQVSSRGGTLITVGGVNLTPTTLVTIGDLPLGSLKFVDATKITGTAPALGPTEAPGPRDVTVSNEIGSSVLVDGIRYVALGGTGDFIRGDLTYDATVDLSDAVRILVYLYLGGTPPDCLDVADPDDNGKVELTDAVFILNYLFLGGAQIASPYPDLGPDPTPDNLPCGPGVPGDVTGFTVAPPSVSLPNVGSTLQIQVTAKLDGKTIDLHAAVEGTTYVSSNPAVLAVYRDGMLEARGPGSATVTVQNGERLGEVEAVVASVGGSPSIKVLAESEYGLCFVDREFSVFTLHPPFSTLRAQVIRTETSSKVTVLSEGQVTLRYSSALDARGSETSRSLDKTDFWETASVAFGRPFEAGAGLLGLFMPGDAPEAGPQPVPYDSTRKLWEAAGVPILQTDDSNAPNSFPLMRVTALDSVTLNPLAFRDVPLPVSQEVDCQNCHASGGVATRDTSIAWSQEVDPELQSKWNILLLHDARVRTNLSANAPVSCTQCHYSALLDPAGVGPNEDQAGAPTLSRALHGFHGKQLDAGGQPIFPSGAPEAETCLQCHPGARNESSRGVMHGAGLECRDCHGGLLQVGAETPLLAGGSIDGTNDGRPRRPWRDEPRCGSCHTGDALSHLSSADLVAAADGLRLRQAYRLGDESASPIKPTNTLFAENAGLSFADSKGHGGLLCASCHGSPHAEWPNPDPAHVDNSLAKSLQGHSGTIMECVACHTPNSMRPNLGGPHGMHPVNDDAWIHKEGIDNHGHLYTEGQASRCRACHGADLMGTPLSRTAADRYYRIEDNIVANLPRGTMVRCNHCHRTPGPGGL